MPHRVTVLQVLRFVAREVAAVVVKDVQVALVVGGGNYFRGVNAWDGLERATADSIGSATSAPPLLSNSATCCAA